jgi:hypothetical protein
MIIKTLEWTTHEMARAVSRLAAYLSEASVLESEDGKQPRYYLAAFEGRNILGPPTVVFLKVPHSCWQGYILLRGRLPGSS